MIEVLGPTITKIIIICWFASGVAFNVYAYKVTKRTSLSVILLLCLIGPYGWLVLLFLHICKPIVRHRPHLKQSAIIASLLLSAIILITLLAITG